LEVKLKIFYLKREPKHVLSGFCLFLFFKNKVFVFIFIIKIHMLKVVEQSKILKVGCGFNL